jgi:hypothetical protein
MHAGMAHQNLKISDMPYSYTLLWYNLLNLVDYLIGSQVIYANLAKK